jgi:hypothetical protein
VPVTTNITSENQRFPTNAEVVIPCVVEGFPAPQVQWYKDGVPLNPSDRIYVAEDHRLSIQQATKADSGTYQCEAANAYSKSSSSITILVDGEFLGLDFCGEVFIVRFRNVFASQLQRQSVFCQL